MSKMKKILLLTSCALTQDTHRKEGSKVEDSNISPLTIKKLLSKQALRLLLDEILAHVTDLPNLNDESDYAI